MISQSSRFTLILSSATTVMIGNHQWIVRASPCRHAPLHRLFPNNSLRPHFLKRTLIAPPQPESGQILMSRRSDRALPDITSSYRVWLRTAPIFAIIVTVSALGIFNYQKSSSSVVAATLYALRTSEVGRRELGDEIYFRDMWPWIWGEMNQLHGRVNISFGVKGNKGKGLMRFRSERKGRMGYVSAIQPWDVKSIQGFHDADSSAA